MHAFIYFVHLLNFLKLFSFIYQSEMTNKILEWKPDLTKEVDKNGWSLHYAAERGCDIKRECSLP